MEKGKTSGYAQVNGLDMYYEDYDSGELPLVLIHGGGSTIASTFGNLLPLLSGIGRMVAVELQAHGRTSDRDGPESFEQDADDIAALLGHLNIERANFLGFSNGGTTTLQIAIRHRGMVNKIIAISACYKREGMVEGFFEGMKNATLADMPARLRTAYLQVAARKDQLQVMFDKDKERMLAFKDLSDEALRSINAATPLMAGDRDLVTLEHMVHMHRLIAGSRLVILPGNHGSFIGEWSALESDSRPPGIAAALVREFLSC